MYHSLAEKRLPLVQACGCWYRLTAPAWDTNRTGFCFTKTLMTLGTFTDLPAGQSGFAARARVPAMLNKFIAIVCCLDWHTSL